MRQGKSTGNWSKRGPGTRRMGFLQPANLFAIQACIVRAQTQSLYHQELRAASEDPGPPGLRIRNGGAPSTSNRCAYFCLFLLRRNKIPGMENKMHFFAFRIPFCCIFLLRWVGEPA